VKTIEDVKRLGAFLANDVAEKLNGVGQAEYGTSAMTETGNLRGRSAWIHPPIDLTDE
jgi:hypothetical protein